MAIAEADVLAVVKTRLQIADTGQDALINSYIPEIGDRILNYCNQDEVPDGLKYTWASMVIDVLRIEQPQMDAIENTSGTGTSVKIGDTTVAPAKSDGVSNTSKSVIDQVAANYRIDLGRYRKLRW
jgi:hypothetical protein